METAIMICTKKYELKRVPRVAIDLPGMHPCRGLNNVPVASPLRIYVSWPVKKEVIKGCAGAPTVKDIQFALPVNDAPEDAPISDETEPEGLLFEWEAPETVFLEFINMVSPTGG